MTEGDIALTPLAQSDGRTKIRPVVLLRRMPPFGDWLVCGVSTQLHQQVTGFDDLIEPTHPDYRGSGLKAASLVRLGYLAVLPAGHFTGVLGPFQPSVMRGCFRGLRHFLQPNGRFRAARGRPGG